MQVGDVASACISIETLKKERAVEVQVNYAPPLSYFTPRPGFPLPSGVTLPTVPPTPPPSSLPSGVAYGLILKVTYSDEVGPLYRIGSNMLVIRKHKCKKEVQMSFVNVHGIGPFTK